MNKIMECSLCLLLFLFYLFHLVFFLYIISMTLSILISLKGLVFYGFFFAKIIIYQKFLSGFST
jgi:hypothetical protein